MQNSGVSTTILAEEGDLAFGILDSGAGSFRNLMEDVNFVKNEWTNETGMKLNDICEMFRK